MGDHPDPRPQHAARRARRGVLVRLGAWPEPPGHSHGRRRLQPSLPLEVGVEPDRDRQHRPQGPVVAVVPVQLGHVAKFMP